MPKIVSRRVNGGIRYGGSNQERHEAKQRRILQETAKEEAGEALSENQKRAPSSSKKETGVLRDKISWQSIPVDEFDLDCASAIKTLVAKLGTYTERNRQLTLEFIAELRKLVVERGGARVTFRATGAGTFAQSTFLRLEHRMGDGEVREHMVPGGFRHMCRDAITRKMRPNNDVFFRKRRKPNWKQRIPYD